MEAKELIKYLKSVGLDVHTSTKARGHQGFYLRKRIDISKNIPSQNVVPTLIHEFAHYIHWLIEPQMERNGGSLEVIFKDDNTELYKKELLKVTHFVDSNSKFEMLENRKTGLKNEIIEYEKIIKNKYPKFMRSKKFKEFDKYIKKSDARYLLKYDRVKIISGVFFKKSRILSINTLEKDFKDMPKEFTAYIKLKSCRKKRARISAKINRLKKYYNRPTELFARFVESLYLNANKTQCLAPNTFKRFEELLNSGYYKQLSDIVYVK